MQDFDLVGSEPCQTMGKNKNENIHCEENNADSRHGPQKYTGRSMKDSHQDLMIIATEWEAFLDDLQQTLDKFAVPRAEQAEIKTIVASTRADIVV